MKELVTLLRLALVSTLLSFLFGCAVQPVSTLQDNKRLTIKLSKYQNKVYVLSGSKAGRITGDDGRNRELSFVFPKGMRFDQCFSVKDRKGVTLGELDSFSLDLPRLHRRLTNELRGLDQRIARDRQNQQHQTRIVSSAQSALRSSPAYRGGACILPQQKSIPAKPKVPCKTRKQCVSEAAAICYTIMFQAEGCGFAAKKLGVSGILGNPACTAAATELAGKKYGLGSAIMDAMQGGVDDVAKDLLNSKDTFSQFIGGLAWISNFAVKAGRAEACHQEIVAAQYDTPLRAWADQVDLIKRGPSRSRKHCERSIVQVRQAKLAIKKYGQTLSKKSAKRKEVAKSLSKAERGADKLGACKAQ